MSIASASETSRIGVPGVWSLTNALLIVLERPVHPGTHIALDSIFAIPLSFYGISGLIEQTNTTEYYFDGNAGHTKGIVLAAFSLMVVNSVLHLMHFVLGCYDVHRRRHALSFDYDPQKENIQYSV
ncbi:uncharacterized protein N7479_000525 [Penicillium vulpinum]|uniref:Uncharacterized protein n=1 Tax=Penicillium vulpinum TaxID=29845 RepID=A0A1V6S514_9EURO|nr:uncharacterized protein N7479_000525 [Penicillium vulpinum]KAJ5970607.1 hypothetical protein N7479_000525 [Penicillium vulpinum]OQE09132.1 hypothetical protein PENVUL_c007G03349 [Penicillium vulpinum]